MIRTATPFARQLHRFTRRVYAYRYLYLLLLPAVLYIAVFHYGPMYGVQIAFKDYRTSRGILGSDWVGLKHFIRFFQYVDFWTIIRNTVGLSVYGIIVGFPLPVLLSLMLNELNNQRFKKTVQLVTYAPYFISTVVECGLILIFLNPSTGIINHMLAALGGPRIPFMTSPQWFKTVYVFTGVWKNTGWNTIIYLAALSSVSQDCIEAAHVDGASRLRIMFHINLPHILPTMIILLILSTGNILSVGFEKVFLLQNDLNMSTANIISTYTYRVGLMGGEFSYSSAISVFNSIVNVIILTTVNALARRVTETSLF